MYKITYNCEIIARLTVNENIVGKLVKSGETIQFSSFQFFIQKLGMCVVADLE